MALKHGTVRRVPTLENSHTINVARFEETYRELSRLQKCPILRGYSKKILLANNPSSYLRRALASFARAIGEFLSVFRHSVIDRQPAVDKQA